MIDWGIAWAPDGAEEFACVGDLLAVRDRHGMRLAVHWTEDIRRAGPAAPWHPLVEMESECPHEYSREAAAALCLRLIQWRRRSTGVAMAMAAQWGAEP